MKIGYNLYKFEEQYLYTLLQFAYHNHIGIHKLRCNNGMYYCYIHVIHSYRISKLDYMSFCCTIGLFKYIFYSLSFSMIGACICFIVSIVLCSQMILRIDVIGLNDKLNDKFVQVLDDNHIDIYNPLYTYKQLNEIMLDLKKVFIHDIEYLNIYQKGNVFCVEYTIKNKEEIKKRNSQPLIAKKDGMIHSIDVKSGNILVKVNDYVKKGDVLVDNVLLSTDDKVHIIDVEGQIYAYTFEKYRASIVNYDDESDAIFALFLKIRSQLPVDVYIDKENVLQIDKSDSKIEMSVQYTLIENIAYKGE